MRVLLVEDEKELADALRAALSNHRMIADHARDLAEAALILRDAVYDVIVLDRKLPDGDGLSLIPKIRLQGSMVGPTITSANPLPLRSCWRDCGRWRGGRSLCSPT